MVPELHNRRQSAADLAMVLVESQSWVPFQEAIYRKYSLPAKFGWHDMYDCNVAVYILTGVKYK